jgi:hypothetical protein
MSTDLLLVHPGEVLLEEFLRPMGISQYRLALAIGVPESRINAIAVPFLQPERRLLAEDAGPRCIRKASRRWRHSCSSSSRSASLSSTAAQKPSATPPTRS